MVGAAETGWEEGASLFAKELGTMVSMSMASSAKTASCG